MPHGSSRQFLSSCRVTTPTSTPTVASLSDGYLANPREFKVTPNEELQAIPGNECLLEDLAKAISSREDETALVEAVEKHVDKHMGGQGASQLTALQTTCTQKGSEPGKKHTWVRRAHPQLFVIVLKPAAYDWLVTRGSQSIEMNFATAEDGFGGTRPIVAEVTLRIREYSRKGAKRGGGRPGRGAPPPVNLDKVFTKAAGDVVRGAREAAPAEQKTAVDEVAEWR
ncbi:hypothetical protein CYMTET_38220 [Cymbomonas tetramitiformis]|uniref:Uncharacterized protein n=1 Tax=Cymbomonas tetramitiformis TaxID=36881 RepID=A0AAE0CCE8_9CHLO|nr:hypothetical protein CYMTET_38220 [Cymbomonas tetramitiformis]|eukprot:gene3975-4946_t